MSEETTKTLSIDDMAKVEDTQFEFIDVPEWKGRVRIGSLPAGEMLDWVEANEGPAKRTAGLRLIVKSLVDDAGVRIGTDKHIEVFKNKDYRVLNRIVDRILALNGLTPKQKAAEKNDSSEAVSDASLTVLH